METVIDFTQPPDFPMNYHQVPGQIAQIDFAPAKVYTPDGQPDLLCPLTYSVESFKISDDSWARVSCDNDSPYNCHVKIASEHADEYSVNVQACTADKDNCESLSFDMLFNDEKRGSEPRAAVSGCQSCLFAAAPSASASSYSYEIGSGDFTMSFTWTLPNCGSTSTDDCVPYDLVLIYPSNWPTAAFHTMIKDIVGGTFVFSTTDSSFSDNCYDFDMLIRSPYVDSPTSEFQLCITPPDATISLNEIGIIKHSVFDVTNQRQYFVTSSLNGNAICGAITYEITYASPGIENLVTIDSTNIYITNGDYTNFGDWAATLTVGYSSSSCSATDSVDFVIQIVCDVDVNPITLSPQDTSTSFDYDDGYTYVDTQFFDYSHYLCGKPSSVTFSASGTTLDWIDWGLVSNKIYFRITPPVDITTVGVYSVTVVFTDPSSETLTSHFSFTVVDPCSISNLSYYKSGTILNMDYYYIGSTSVTYSLQLQDNVSDFFQVDQVCGVMSLVTYVDYYDAMTENIEDIVTISGDSSSMSVTIYTAQYDLIGSNYNLVVELKFYDSVLADNEWSYIYIKLGYIDGCVAEPPTITLAKFDDHDYSLRGQQSVATDTVTYTETDDWSCLNSCGLVYAYFVWPNSAKSNGLDDVLYIQGSFEIQQDGVVTAAMIGSYEVQLMLTYTNPDCSDYYTWQFFTLDVQCDHSNTAVTLVNQDGIAFDWNFLTDSGTESASFLYSHYECEDPSLTLYDVMENSVDLSWMSWERTSNLITISWTPTLHTQMADSDYQINASVTWPTVNSIYLFDLNIIDLCDYDAGYIIFDHYWVPALQPYSIGSSSQTYSMVMTDNISYRFSIANVCGDLTLSGYSETSGLYGNDIGDLITIAAGSTSDIFILTVYNTDYYQISSSGTSTIQISVQNARWAGVTINQSFDVDVVYVDPCSLQAAHITLNTSFDDITVSIIQGPSQLWTQDFSYTYHDCVSTCGSVVSSLPVSTSISSYMSTDDVTDTLSISGIDYNDIGSTFDLTLRLKFEYCSTFTEAYFKVFVVCDKSDGDITMDIVADAVVDWDFIEDSNKYVYFWYSHYYCGDPSVTFTDQNANSIAWFSYSRSVYDGKFYFYVSPKLYSQVGIYTISGVWTYPRAQTIEVFTFTINDPCLISNTNLNWWLTFTPTTTNPYYVMGSSPKTYSIKINDQISSHFGVDYTCGSLTYQGLTEVSATTIYGESIGQLMTITQGIDKLLTLTLDDDDYYIMTDDSQISIELILYSDRHSQSITGINFNQLVYYTNPCDVQASYIQINSLVDMEFDCADQTRTYSTSISHSSHDCLQTCGSVVSSLTNTANSLSSYISTNDVDSQIECFAADNAAIGSTLTFTLKYEYEYCSSVSASESFSISLNCDNDENVGFGLTPFSDQDYSFDFIAETSKSIYLTYSHWYCGQPSSSAYGFFYNDGVSNNNFDYSVSFTVDDGTTMSSHLTFTPTLYSHVGTYQVATQWSGDDTAPSTGGQLNLFTFTVNDPCTFTNPLLQMTHVFVPDQTGYQIDDAAETHTLYIRDSVSYLFGVASTCGDWTVSAFTDKEQPTRTIYTDMMTITGKSSALTWVVDSSDHSAVPNDMTITFTLTFYSSQMDESQDYDVDFKLRYQDPCVIEPAYVSIDSFTSSITYSVYDPSVSTNYAFTYSSHDCLTTCGSVIVSTNSAINNRLSLSGNDLVVSGAVSSEIGTYNNQVLYAQFQNCEVSDTRTFTLSIVCDASYNTIELTPTSNTALEFNFLNDTTSVVTFTYSHYQCGRPTIYFRDASDNVLSFFTYSLTGDELTVTAKPTLYSQVGTYTVTMKFDDHDQTSLSSQFTIDVNDPCQRYIIKHYQVWDAPFSAFTMGDTVTQSYSLVIGDDVSDFFGYQVCGTLSLSWIAEQSNVLTEDIDTIFTISGTSTQMSVSYYTEDWWAIQSDQNIIVKVVTFSTFMNEYFDFYFDVNFIYVDPCIIRPHEMTLYSVPDFTHGIWNPAATTTQSFTYHYYDCTKLCGSVSKSMLFPLTTAGTALKKAQKITLDTVNDVITVQANIGNNYFGDYEMTLYIRFADCHDVTDFQTITITVACDNNDGDSMSLTSTGSDDVDYHFDFTDSVVSVSNTYTYSHYLCGTASMVFTDEGAVSSMVSYSQMGDTITVTVTPPKTYSLVGSHNFDSVVTSADATSINYLSPVVKSFDDLFVVDIIDPCVQADIVFNARWDVALDPYVIGAAAKTYVMEITDNISDYFSVDQTCETLFFSPDGVDIEPIGIADIITVSGTGSNAVSVSIHSNDYWFIEEDQDFQISFDFYSYLWSADLSKLYTETLSLTYTEPCSVQNSWLVLNNFGDFTHESIALNGVIAVDTRMQFTYNETDCFASCGEVVGTLTFPAGAPSDIGLYVYVDGDYVVVNSAIDYNYFGNYDVVLTIAYEDDSCKTVSEKSQTFELFILCDLANSAITLTAVGSTSLIFDFVDEAYYDEDFQEYIVTTNFIYSHGLCLPRTLSIKDGSANNLDTDQLVTNTLQAGSNTLNFVISPLYYSQVGTYYVTVTFTEPKTATFVDLFSFTVNDPCVQADVLWTKNYDNTPSAYTIGSDPQSYTFNFSDNVSDWFMIYNTCGVMTLVSVAEQTSHLSPFGSFVTATQSEGSTTLTVEINDYYQITSDQNMIMVLTFTNSMWGTQMTERVSLNLQYVDPCDVQSSSVSLSTFQSEITYSVIDQSVSDDYSFTYTSHDCLLTCGTVTSSIDYPAESMGLSSYISISGSTVTITGIPNSFIGTISLNLHLEYSSCPSTFDNMSFTLFVVCDSSDSEIVLTEIDDSDYEFTFITDTSAVRSIGYSHYQCGKPMLTIVHDGAEIPFFNYELDGMNIKFTAVPTLFSEIGMYTLGVVFSSPRTQTISPVVLFEVVNVCDSSFVQWSRDDQTYYDSMSESLPYTFGDSTSYTISWTDNVSEHFGTNDICGVWDVSNFADTNSVLADFTNIVQISGSDTSSLTVAMFSDDYWLTSADVTLNIGMDWTINPSGTWLGSTTKTQNLPITLIYKAPCDAQNSWLFLSTISDFDHDVLVTSSDTTTVAYTYTATDCISSCGAVVGTLTYPVGAPSDIADVIYISGDNIVVGSMAQFAHFGSYDLMLSIQYENDLCVASDQKTFNLDIVCSKTNSAISLTTTDSTALGFDFIQDQSGVTLSWIYSHAYCAIAAVTFIDQNGDTVPFVTYEMFGDSLIVTALPTLYSQVGLYTISAVFTSPLLQTIPNLFSVTVNEPCNGSNLGFTATPSPSPYSDYSFGATEASYQIQIGDPVSTYFATDAFCGLATLQSLVEYSSDGVFDYVPLSDYVTLTLNGDDSTAGYGLYIYSEDYWLTMMDTTVTFRATFVQTERSITFTHDIQITFVYVDPCTVRDDELLLNDFNSFSHGIWDPTVNTSKDFSYTFWDCKRVCGDIYKTIYFPQTIEGLALKEFVSVDTIFNTIDVYGPGFINMGDFEFVVYIEFQSCNTLSDYKQFTLTIECDNLGDSVEFTPSTRTQTFEWMTETAVSVQYTYDHYICGDPLMSFTGPLATMMSYTFSGDTIVITTTPAVDYSLVGRHDISPVLAYPHAITIIDLFDIELIDPCYQSNVVWAGAWDQEISDYPIGQTQTTFTFVLTDNVSDFFGVLNTCGTLTFDAGFEDEYSNLSTMSDIVTVTGTDSTSVSVSFFNDDYWWIEEDTSFTMTFDFYSSLWDSTLDDLYTQNFQLIYTEPCSVQNSWLVLDQFDDFSHNAVIMNDMPVDTRMLFTYNETDCFAACGEVVGTLTFPAGAPADIGDHVYVEEDYVVVDSDIDYNYFGTYEIVLTIAYEDVSCRTVSQKSQSFSLTIECDSANGPITMSPQTSTSTTFSFMDESFYNADQGEYMFSFTYMYSHAYCEEADVASIKDQNDDYILVDWYEKLDDYLLSYSFRPKYFSEVGSYTVNLGFDNPKAGTFEALFDFVIVDPCYLSNVVWYGEWDQMISDYPIGQTLTTFTFDLTDNVSDFFGVANTCGLLTFDAGFEDEYSELSTMSDIVTVSGSDNTGVSVSFFNDDYWWIEEDTSFTMTFDFYSSLWDSTLDDLFSQVFQLIYTEPCSVQNSWLVLDQFDDFSHNAVIMNDMPVDTRMLFTYNETDCFAACGAVVGTLTFPAGAPADIGDHVYVEEDYVVVDSDIDYNYFGTYEIVLTIAYEDTSCRTVSEKSQSFSLTIECDSANGPITMSPQTSTSTTFTFMDESFYNADEGYYMFQFTYMYSHAYCEKANVASLKDQNDDYLMVYWSENLDGYLLSYYFYPQYFSEVGSYTVNLGFDYPKAGTFEALFDFVIVDPCNNDQIQYFASFDTDNFNYKIGDTETFFSMTLYDNVSDFFGNANTCGSLERTQVADKNQVDPDFDYTEIFSITGSVNTEPNILRLNSTDYFYWSESTQITLEFTVYHAQLDTTLTFEWTMYLQYTDPCTVRDSWLFLDKFEDFSHSVYVDGDDSTSQAFTFFTLDCLSTCGAIVGELHYSDEGNSLKNNHDPNLTSIGNSVEVSDHDVVVLSTASFLDFGTWEILLGITYENCPGTVAAQWFSLAINCDSGDNPLTMTTIDSIDLTFIFVEDTVLSLPFIYSHSYCTYDNIALFYDQNGEKIDFISYTINENELVILVAPTLYSEVGYHTVTMVFQTPKEQTFYSLFTVTVVDPCTSDNVWFEAEIEPALESYTIGDDAQSYTIVFTDNISDFFEVHYTCGTPLFNFFKETTQVYTGDLPLTITGTDTSNMVMEVYSVDYWALDADTAIMLSLSFNNELWSLDTPELFAFELPLVYMDPCVAIEPSYITLATELSIEHSVIDPDAVTYQTFSFTNYDCTKECGQVLHSLKFSDDDVGDLLWQIVHLNDLTIEISGGDFLLFGDHTISLYSEYEFCPDVSDTFDITLTMICDATDSPITLEPDDEAFFYFDFFLDTSYETSYTYSHYLCNPVDLTVSSSFTQSQIFWVTFYSESDQLFIAWEPLDYDTVGDHWFTVDFYSPMVTQIQNVAEIYIEDPCDLTRMDFYADWFIDLEPYTLGDARVTYNFSLGDDISDLFDVPFTCGIWEFMGFAQTETDLQNMSEFMWIDGPDSSNLELAIHSENFWLINTYTDLEVELVVYFADDDVFTYVHVNFIYTDVCSAGFAGMTYIYPLEFDSMTYSVIDPDVVESDLFAYHAEECGTCGAPQGWLRYPDGSLANLTEVSWVDLQDSLVKMQGANWYQYGEYLVKVEITFENCPVMRQREFTLTVLCDESNSMLTLSPTNTTDFQFDYINQTESYLYYDYSHYYCEPPVVQYLDSRYDQEVIDFLLDQDLPTDPPAGPPVESEYPILGPIPNRYTQIKGGRKGATYTDVTELPHLRYNLTDERGIIRIITEPEVLLSRIDTFDVTMILTLNITEIVEIFEDEFVLIVNDPCERYDIHWYTVHEDFRYTFGLERKNTKMVVNDIVSDLFEVTAVCGYLHLEDFFDGQEPGEMQVPDMKKWLGNVTHLSQIELELSTYGYQGYPYIGVQDVLLSMDLYSDVRDENIRFEYPVYLTDRCWNTKFIAWEAFFEDFTILNNFQTSLRDLDAFIFRNDTISRGMNDALYCGPHHYGYVYAVMPDSEIENYTFDDVITIINNGTAPHEYPGVFNNDTAVHKYPFLHTLEVGPSLDLNYYQFQINMTLDWYMNITTEPLEELEKTYALFFVEAIDACAVTMIYPLETDFTKGQTSFYGWTIDNMNKTTDHYFDDEKKYVEKTDSYREYWENTQVIANMEADVNGGNVTQSLYYISDYMSDVYQASYGVLASGYLCGEPKYSLKVNGSAKILSYIYLEQDGDEVTLVVDALNNDEAGIFEVQLKVVLFSYSNVTHTLTFEVTITEELEAIIVVSQDFDESQGFDPPKFVDSANGNPPIQVSGEFMKISGKTQWELKVADSQKLKLPAVTRYTEWSTVFFEIQLTCADSDFCEYITYIGASPASGSHYLSICLPPTFVGTVQPIKLTMVYGNDRDELYYNFYMAPQENPAVPKESDWQNEFDMTSCSLIPVEQEVEVVDTIPVAVTVVAKVANPDKVNTELVALKAAPENILVDGTNLADYEYGQSASFVDINGNIQEVVVCTPSIKSVTMKGEITVIFPRQIEPITEQDKRDIVASNSLQMTVIRDSDVETSLIDFTWIITETNDRGFVVQMIFTDPTQVSHSSSQSDQMSIVFNGIEEYVTCKTVIEVSADQRRRRRRLQDSSVANSTATQAEPSSNSSSTESNTTNASTEDNELEGFVSKDPTAVQPVDKIPSGFAMTFAMPPQVDPFKENEIENLVNKSEATAQWVVYGSLILSWIFRISMTMILSAVNALQMISHLPMFNILLTENLFHFLGEIQAIVGWDVYNPFTKTPIGFTQTLPLYERFSWIGYVSQNYFENIGSIALLQVVFLFRALLNPTMHLLNRLGVKRMAQSISWLKIGRVELCNATIMVFLEAYFEMLIGALIAVNMYKSIESGKRTGADQWTMGFAMMTLLPVLAFPLFVSWYTLWHVRWLIDHRKRDMLIVVFDKENLKLAEKKEKKREIKMQALKAELLAQAENQEVHEDGPLQTNRVDTDREMLGGQGKPGEIIEMSQLDGPLQPKKPVAGLAVLAMQVELAQRVKLPTEEEESDGGYQIMHHEMLSKMKETKLKLSVQEELDEEIRIQGYQMFAALSYDLKETSHSAQGYNFSFIWRRIIFTFTALYTIKPLAQVYCYVIVSLGMCVYLFWSQPFQTRRRNLMEMFNEYLILIIGLHELVLLGFVDGYHAKQSVGSMMIFFILFLAGVNFLGVGVNFLFQMYRRSKRDYLFKKTLRNIDKIKQARKFDQEKHNQASSVDEAEDESEEISVIEEESIEDSIGPNQIEIELLEVPHGGDDKLKSMSELSAAPRSEWTSKGKIKGVRDHLGDDQIEEISLTISVEQRSFGGKSHDTAGIKHLGDDMIEDNISMSASKPGTTTATGKKDGTRAHYGDGMLNEPSYSDIASSANQDGASQVAIPEKNALFLETQPKEDDSEGPVDMSHNSFGGDLSAQVISK